MQFYRKYPLLTVSLASPIAWSGYTVTRQRDLPIFQEKSHSYASQGSCLRFALPSQAHPAAIDILMVGISI